MSNYMADEEKDPQEGQEESETSEESSTEETEGEPKEEKVSEEEEPKVPLSRLRQERDKRLQAEKQLKTSGQEEKPPPEASRAGEGKSLREQLEEIEAEKAEEEKKAKEEFDQKLEDLKLVDPTLDENAFMDIIEKYNVADPDQAFKIYQDLKAGKTPKIKPKMPSAPKTTDEVASEEFKPEEAKSTWDAVQRGLKKFGL